MPGPYRGTAALKALKPVLAVVLIAVLGAFGWALMWPQAPAIMITEATATPMPNGALVLAMTLTNLGDPDRLTGASSPEGDVVIAGAEGDLALPTGSTPKLAMDGAHLILTGLTGQATDGRLIPLTLTFQTAGPATTRARLTPPPAQMAHMQTPLDAPTGPSVSLTVTPQGDTYRVTVAPQNFRFAQDLVDGPHQPGTGHGHLYLNGLKLQRLYAPQAVIGALPRGRHQVKVVLNTNDHRAYAVAGEPVAASAAITVP